jgi:large subunit ribosomal protein L6
MSRVGKKEIGIPKGVKVELADGVFVAKGPKGEVRETLPPAVSVVIEADRVAVARKGNSGPERAQHGLTRALLANAVAGVVSGFSKDLQVVGVGFRAEAKGREVHFALGFSHPVVYALPPGIDVEIDRQLKITVRGANRQQVGQVAAEIRALRPPDPYKGKGIRYANEVLRLKEGKKGA